MERIFNGYQCRKLREAKGILSAVEFARRINVDGRVTVTQTWISKIESGGRQPNDELFAAICRVLDVEPERLLLPEYDPALARDVARVRLLADRIEQRELEIARYAAEIAAIGRDIAERMREGE